MQIMADEEFVFDVCTLDGELQYLLPAHMNVFQRLAELDSLYSHLFALLDNEKNGVLRYTRHFYETFYRHGDILLQLLWERAGWRPQ